MVVTSSRFATKTLDGLVDLLLTRRAVVAHSADALRREAADALSQRDVSDVLDHENPSADSDAVTVLMLIERAEGCLWEVEAALARIDNGTYGFCASCGDRIPLVRLRALPATASCIGCSRRSSRGAVAPIGHEVSVEAGAQ